MEVGEKTSKLGFAVNRYIEFTLGTRYVYVKERQLPITFNFRGEGYIGVQLVEKFKEKRYVVQESEKNHVPLDQLVVVRNLLKLNGFPSHIFESITLRFLDNTFHPKKKIIYFCLPFTARNTFSPNPHSNQSPL